jgi:hypothetical protein
VTYFKIRSREHFIANEFLWLADALPVVLKFAAMTRNQQCTLIWSLETCLSLPSQVGPEALMQAPSVRGLGSELHEVVQRMLVKGQPDFTPTGKAETTRVRKKKQNLANEGQAVAKQTESEEGRYYSSA